MKLYHYVLNSAGHRVRIALALKGLAFESVLVDLRAGRDQQKAPDYLAINPQGLIPALAVGGHILTQSMAIIEYLDEAHPTPPLLPSDPIGRAQVRAFAQAIACDMHPLNNTGVLAYLTEGMGVDSTKRAQWYAHTIAKGFSSLEILAQRSAHGTFALGDTPSLADVLLVPQWGNARRYKCDVAPYPRLAAIVAACEALPAFRDAAPEAQPGFAEIMAGR